MRRRQAIERFQRVGYEVVQGASDWLLQPQDREIQVEVLSGWAAAARDIGQVAAARGDRLADAPARSGRCRALVHPRRSRRFFRAADRDALSRQVAVEQHLVVEPVHRASASARASSTRAIGGSAKLARPEPRMIGATMTCSRSRHFAARKRDTVSAPPSISTRRNPRSASAARIAAGASCPSVSAMSTISTSDGNGGRAPAAVTTRRRTPSLARSLAPPERRPLRVDDDPRRMRAADPPHGELRIVGERRADADHHRIHQRPQPVQVGETRRPVDVVRMAGFGRDPAVQRLADLRRPPRGRRPGRAAAGRTGPPTAAATGRSRARNACGNGGPGIHVRTGFARRCQRRQLDRRRKPDVNDLP